MSSWVSIQVKGIFKSVSSFFFFSVHFSNTYSPQMEKRNYFLVLFILRFYLYHDSYSVQSIIKSKRKVLLWPKVSNNGSQESPNTASHLISSRLEKKGNWNNSCHFLAVPCVVLFFLPRCETMNFRDYTVTLPPFVPTTSTPTLFLQRR